MARYYWEKSINGRQIEIFDVQHSSKTPVIKLTYNDTGLANKIVNILNHSNSDVLYSRKILKDLCGPLGKSQVR